MDMVIEANMSEISENLSYLEFEELRTDLYKRLTGFINRFKVPATYDFFGRGMNQWEDFITLSIEMENDDKVIKRLENIVNRWLNSFSEYNVKGSVFLK